MPRKISFTTRTSSPSSKSQQEHHHHHHHTLEASEGGRSQRSASTSSSSSTAVALNPSPLSSPASSIASAKRRRSRTISNSSQATIDSLAPPPSAISSKSPSNSPSKIKLFPGKVVRKVKSGIHKIGEIFETHHHHHHHHYYYTPGQEPVEGGAVKEEKALEASSPPDTIEEEQTQPTEQQQQRPPSIDSPASIPLPITPDPSSPLLNVVALPSPSPRRARKLSKIRRVSLHGSPKGKKEGSKGEFSIGSAIVAGSTAMSAPVHPFFGVVPGSGSTPQSTETSTIPVPPDSPSPHSKAKSKSRLTLFPTLPRRGSISGPGTEATAETLAAPGTESSGRVKELKSSKSNEELKAPGEKQKLGLGMRMKGWRSKSITAASSSSFVAAMSRRASSVSNGSKGTPRTSSVSEFGEEVVRDVKEEERGVETQAADLRGDGDDADAGAQEDDISPRLGLLSPISEGAVEPEHPSPIPVSPDQPGVTSPGLLFESLPLPVPTLEEPTSTAKSPEASFVLVPPMVYVESEVADEDPFVIYDGKEVEDIPQAQESKLSPPQPEEVPSPAHLSPRPASLPSLGSQHADDVDSIMDTSERPYAETTYSDEDGSEAGIPDLFLPGLIIPTMFFPQSNPRRSLASNLLTWWLSPPSTRTSSRSSMTTTSSRW
ncbi:hypothetical protein AX16_003909 [Volvariella volvacea WC 439]|nr:hypothetical protein AX16_003909 [Volvariella volvacea WC 439]